MFIKRKRELFEMKLLYKCNYLEQDCIVQFIQNQEIAGKNYVKK